MQNLDAIRGDAERWMNSREPFDAPGQALGTEPHAPKRVEWPEPRRLNVGCGNQRMEGWIGIDLVATEATDVVRDIRRGLPFDDDSVEEILCDNVLEHIGPPEDFIFILNEF